LFFSFAFASFFLVQKWRSFCVFSCTLCGLSCKSHLPSLLLFFSPRNGVQRCSLRNAFDIEAWTVRCYCDRFCLFARAMEKVCVTTSHLCFYRKNINFCGLVFGLFECEKVFVWHARFSSCENCCFCYLFLREILFLGLRLLLASEEWEHWVRSLSLEDGRWADMKVRSGRCSACFKQFSSRQHLLQHLEKARHSEHEPQCGVCHKHCPCYESLREHLLGKPPHCSLPTYCNYWDCLNSWG
jgi:hypothetical protein